MEISELLDEILKNYSNASTVSLQIQAHHKNIDLLSAELKKSHDKGVNSIDIDHLIPD